MSLDYKVFSGVCPDDRCKTKLYFAAHKTVIECPNCGQRHSQSDLGDIEEVTDGEEAITQVLKSIVWDMKMPKKGSDSVKVHGLSNYHCKLLSPLFTHYGMDKGGNPRLLSELGHGDTADCGRLLCHRAFLISPEHINIVGYGKDQSGSVEYLQDMLDIVKAYQGGEDLLIPIHADGDGHCLVHALSRATTGREIFWHALRDNLVNHLGKNLSTYKNLFRDFIDVEDWRTIIEEADPYHMSPDGFNVGLGNIHIFALANVLKRPIVLLDSLEGMRNVADYTAIFVPALVDPAECRGNFPLCVAWSGASHNHFVPLVGVADRPLPRIPPAMIPNIWGIDKAQAMQYLTFNNDGSLTVAGGKPLQKQYILRLVTAMEHVFLERYNVSAELVADMHLYVYQRVGFVGLHPEIAIEKTRDAVVKNKVFRCLVCHALSQANVDDDSLRPGGYLFSVMLTCHGTPRTNTVYHFPAEELQCKYDPVQNCLTPFQFPCTWCKTNRMRRVDRFGSVNYCNGDPTSNPAQVSGSCCGFKHFWNGREYDNIPKQFMVNITLKGKSIEEQIIWFYGDSDSTLNSNAAELSQGIADKYFGLADSDADEHTEKIMLAIQSKLAELNIPDPDLTEVSGLSSYSRRARQDTAASSTLTETNTAGDSIPSTSKRVVKKREANGAVKPPSPTVRHAGPLGSDSPPTEHMSVDTVQKCGSTDESHSQFAVEPQGHKVRVRISASDGRQAILQVAGDMDYRALQNLVITQFGIERSRQVLKVGFPPKLLATDPEGGPLCLRNGDRITVEIKTKVTEQKMAPIKKVLQRGSIMKRGLYDPNKDSSVTNLKSFVDLLQGTIDHSMTRQLPLKSESIDAALTAVLKMVKITGKSSVWEYAISHPELFVPGGAFYEQFSRDIGLINGRHCMLPLMPGRVFRYNGDPGRDRIELCLEPTGHFQISPGITDIIDRIAAEGNQPGDCSESVHEIESAVALPSTSATVMTSQPSAIEVNVKESPHADNQGSGDTDAGNAMDTEPTTKLQRVESPAMLQNRDAVEDSTKVDAKMAPGYTAVGLKPTEVTREEAEMNRQELMKVLQAKKQSGQDKP